MASLGPTLVATLVVLAIPPSCWVASLCCAGRQWGAGVDGAASGVNAPAEYFLRVGTAALLGGSGGRRGDGRVDASGSKTVLAR